MALGFVDATRLGGFDRMRRRAAVSGGLVSFLNAFESDGSWSLQRVCKVNQAACQW